MTSPPPTSIPLVSVVLPVKNGERFIANAVKSVLSQSWRPLELFVVDGNSTDRTRAILADLAVPQLHVLDQVGGGIPGAWNQGIRAATGEYLAFISADDQWLPGKIDRQVTMMQDHADLLYTITKFRYVVEPDVKIPSTFNRDLLGRDLVGRIMETLVVRRQALDLVGLLDERYATAHDVDWYARANALEAPHAIVEDVLLLKRVHDANASTNPDTNTPELFRALRASLTRRRDAKDTR